MATKTIAWKTGSGNITLTYTGQGNDFITVASTENETFDDRSQSINIITTSGSPEKAVSVLIKQQGKKYNVGDVFNFAYTGSVQQVTLPKGKYKLQCWGAQGGTSYGSSSGSGSKGGYSEGIITLTETTTFYIFVGGQGSRGSSSSLVNGGWNGGGASVGFSYYNSGGTYGESYPACGGGATDISTVTSSMSYSNGRTNRSSASLLARCIVAGGGAGGSYRYTYEQVTVENGYEWVLVDYASVTPTSNDVNSSGLYQVQTTFYPTKGNTYRVTISPGSNPSNGIYVGVSNYGSSASNGVSFVANGSWVSATVTLEPKALGSSFDIYFEEYQLQYTTEEYESSGYSNKSQQGGGTSGKGQYPGTQTSAGSGGGFGYGANQASTNYRYCGGAGGGGWYGGGTSQSDSSTSYVNYSGGGSGFVNTAANASSRPSGYTGLQLDSGTTTAGNSSFPSTSGGTETGHSGNGYARITVID